MAPHHGYSRSTNSLMDDKTSISDGQSISDDGSEQSASAAVEKRNRSPSYAITPSVPLEYARSMPWRVVSIKIVSFLTPSFLQKRHSRERTRLHPTSYLDGMRGLAALFVFFCHYFYQAFIIAEGYGCPGNGNNWNYLKLPILRLWYQGPAAVCVFFVVSGYALSYRPLKLIRSHSHNDLLTTMSSLTFRRAIRLFLPSIISTFMIFCLIRLGAYDSTRVFANNRAFMKNVKEPHPERLASAYQQFYEWFWNVFKFVHVFSWNPQGGRIDYDLHLWTIPIEYRCSLFIFLILIGTARLKTYIRFLTIGSIMAFAYRSSRWDFFLFMVGMLIAEHDLIRGAHTPQVVLPVNESTPVKTKTRFSTSSALWVSASIVGLYLMSQPDKNGHITPGWVYLCSLVPKWWDAEGYRYWQTFGSAILVLSVGHSPAWQRVFNSAVVQYLGKISYALYLMHGPVMHVIGYHIEPWAYSITGTDGLWFNAGFALHALFIIPITIWVSDIFWRAVDVPTVRFGKWFEGKCLIKES